MIPLSSAVSSGFSFSGISRGYELKLDDQVVGTLERASFWSCNYVATTQEGSWRFRRGGFFNTGAEIVDSASQQTIATLKAGWGGKGELTFSDGQKFLLGARGWWRPVWSVTTESGEPVLELRTREKLVEVPNATAVAARRLSLLAMFTLYRMRQAEEDAASAAMVGVIAAS